MDPYVYPGTSVLRNLRDIRDVSVLAALEADATSRRIRQSEHQPIRGKLNALHLQAIHRHIFQDVYEWAGEFRTVNIARPGQFYFAFAEQILPCLENLLTSLTQERHLAAATSPDEFCDRAAYYMGELNAVHPFRDGNGRTQREFIRQLALKNGYAIHWSRIARPAMNEASGNSFQHGDNAGLAAILQMAIEPARAGR